MTTNINFTEFEKLHSMLTKADIPHTFNTLWDGLQIKIYADAKLTKELDDAVIHSGSHGVSSGLLETYCLSNCRGWETADEIFSGWLKMYHKANFKPFCDCSIIGAEGEMWEGFAPSWD